MAVVQNPLLATVFTPWFTDLRLHGPTVPQNSSWPNYTSIIELPIINDPDFLKKEAPWRALQIQEPPVTVLVVEKRTVDRGADNVERKTLSFPGGLRMGTLYDLTWSYCLTVDRLFGVRWDGIALSAEESGKGLDELGFNGMQWRSEKFLPPLGGQNQVLLELVHPEWWFLKNYKSGLGLPKNKVEEWEKYRSEGMDETELGEEVEKVYIQDQTYSKDEL